MKYYMILLCLAFTATLGACATTQTPSPIAKNQITKSESVEPLVDDVARFDIWKQDFTKQATAKGYDSALLAATIGQAKINPKAIKKYTSQPEFTRTVWSYLDSVQSETRVRNGHEKLILHDQLFGELEALYGVDRHILTSIWGLESAYGTYMGTDNMIDSLSTLAFDGRKKKFGEQQLYGILDLLAAGAVRQDQLIGSWAGAMGMTQFIPTSFRDYAVDYDNNGNKNLWTDAGDALASSASYLVRFGWRKSEPVYHEIILPEGFNYGLSDGTKRTIAGWAAMGVRPLGGENWSNDALFLEAKVFIPAGNKGPTFLTFKNFDVIMKYNNSTSYALGIAALANTLQGNQAINQEWPRADKALSLSERKSMQQALTDKGFDTGGVDGVIGANSRRAIRAWQKANGQPVDGYVNQDVLRRIVTD